MKHTLHVNSMIIGALLSAVIILTVAAANKERTSWEYLAQNENSSHPDHAALNKLGDEGWEAVGAFSWPDSKGFLFKRQK